MRYFKFKTGKVVHCDNCEHAKGNREITEAEAREVVFEKGGSYCEATMQARVDEQREELKDCTTPVDPHQPDWDAEKPPGIRDALLDQLQARMYFVNERRNARKRQRDMERAAALGLEPGDTVERIVPNRGVMRSHGTNAARNGRIMGRPAARRKSHASIYTHRAVVIGEVTLRVGVGQPVQTGVPMRKRDRVRSAASR